MAVDGHQFGGGIADYVVVAEETTGELTLGADTPVWFYNAHTGGSRYVSGLTDLTGVTITEVTSDSNGGIPQLRGPAGVTVLWADASGGAGPRRLMVATDLGEEVSGLGSRVATLESEQAALHGAPAWVRRNPSTGAWPARPATGRMVVWLDTLPETPSPPPIGGVGMADNLDLYFGSA